MSPLGFGADGSDLLLAQPQDERSTTHRAPTDVYEHDAELQLFRTTLVGQPMTGVDGRTSEIVEGEPMLSCAEELAIHAEKGAPVGLRGVDGNSSGAEAASPAGVCSA